MGPDKALSMERRGIENDEDEDENEGTIYLLFRGPDTGAGRKSGRSSAKESCAEARKSGRSRQGRKSIGC